VDDPRDTRPLLHPGRGQLINLPTAGAARGSHASANDAADGLEVSGAELFALLWHALADVLGTAAAATLLRRAARLASPASPELLALEVTSASLDYGYRVPQSWNAPSAEPPPALFELIRELWGLLVELTGGVVVARLLQISPLRDRGLVPPRDRP